MKATSFILTLLILGMGLFTACEEKPAKEEGIYYTCPMHPEIRKEVPGQCPICKMDLVKKEDHSNHRH